jgi:mannose-6-phosphate isomerase
MTAARPVKVHPRLDAKPWGGRRLQEWGIHLPPDETIGEALLTAPEAMVASGPLAGLTVADLARTAPESWVGRRGLEVTGGRAIFPLLVKLIDGQADLSVQVHPDDRAAAAADLGTGKTEAYHILAAEPGAVIYLGLTPGRDPSDFAAACRRADGSAARFLRQFPAEPGKTILIPAGTPHALGAGAVIYEIQQPSNVTFRLDDWGRLDAAGRPRQLHHDAGLAIVDFRSQPAPIPPLTLGAGPGKRAILVATRYFALELIALETSAVVRLPAVESPQVLTCIEGAAILDAGGWVSSLAKGETLIVPVGSPAALTGSGRGVLLRGWVPDLEREIAAPAIAAGVSQEALDALGVNTGK